MRAWRPALLLILAGGLCAAEAEGGGIVAHWHPLAIGALLVLVAAIAAFFNVMAGGGSLLTMPALMLFGLDAAAANGTNRIALLWQNIVSVWTFRRRGYSDWRLSLSLSACALPGAVIGALAAVEISDQWFQRVLIAVMLLVLIQMWWRRGGQRHAEGDGQAPSRRRVLIAHVAMVGLGLYGGFIQAGVGFLIMAVLGGVLRLDLVRVNMHKVFIVGAWMVPSLAVFAWHGSVWWWLGLLQALGQGLGAWISTRVSISKGDRVVRIVFTVAVLTMAAALLWRTW